MSPVDLRGPLVPSCIADHWDKLYAAAGGFTAYSSGDPAILARAAFWAGVSASLRFLVEGSPDGDELGARFALAAEEVLCQTREQLQALRHG